MAEKNYDLNHDSVKAAGQQRFKRTIHAQRQHPAALLPNLLSTSFHYLMTPHRHLITKCKLISLDLLLDDKQEVSSS